MITSLLALTLAAGTSISGARASLNDGRLVVTVEATLPLAPESVRGDLDGHRLRLELSGVALDEDRRDFGTGEIPVRSVAATERVVLEATLPALCHGAVRIEPAPAGLRAEVDCRPPPPSPVPVIRPAEVAPPLVPEAPTSVTTALATSTSTSPNAPLPAALAGVTSFSEPPHPPILAGLVLVALAGAALFLSRRSAHGPSHLRVEQSTSLGPRRALVVVRLGEELLVLGSSEGGIHLLATRPAPAESAPVAKKSLLAQLGLGAKSSPAFEDLLREDTEDELLRRKLEAGLAARVR